MTNPLRIFIGWDPREAAAADVLEWSLRRHSSIPLEIYHLRRDAIPWLRNDERPGSTAFTYSRFAIPWLCDYSGLALFLDCDMLCFGDIAEVAALPMDGLAIRVRKHEQHPQSQTKMDGQPQIQYPRKNWSSLMLMDCSRLRLWNPSTVGSMSGAWLHRFEGVLDQSIGDLPTGWNELFRYREGETKLLHFTEFNPILNPGVHPDEELWHDARRQMRQEAA